MFRSRRIFWVALAAFLLAFVPATSSARAQRVRWLQLHGDPATTPHVGVEMIKGNRTARFRAVELLKRSDVANARFVGRGGEVALKDKLREQDFRLVELQAEQLNQSPGWVAVELQPVDLEWSIDRWREFLAAEAMLDVLRPEPALQQVHIRGLAHFKLLVHRGNAAPSDVVTRPLGQTLEVVPLTDPMALTGNRLPVRVLLKGQPLARARVYAATTEAPASTSATTDAEGKAMLTLSTGWWVIFVSTVQPAGPTGAFDVLGSATTMQVR